MDNKKDSVQEIWTAFMKKAEEDNFKDYMGYSIQDIKRIGIKEFISTMGWTSKDEVGSYRTDKIKVIICRNCHKHFTTLQMDYGLCENCKDDFALKYFDRLIEAECGLVSKNGFRGYEDSVANMEINYFAYSDEYRNMFKKNRPMKQIVSDCCFGDYLSGAYTIDMLEMLTERKDGIKDFINTFKDSKDEIFKNVKDTYEKLLNSDDTDWAIDKIKKNIIVINEVFKDDSLSNEEKIEKLKQEFKDE